MSEGVREMTREELIAENRDLKKEIEKRDAHIKHFQEEIIRIQGIDIIPEKPIDVAAMLVNYTGPHENVFTVNTRKKEMFDREDLREIAFHLLAYCDNGKEY